MKKTNRSLLKKNYINYLELVKKKIEFYFITRTIEHNLKLRMMKY